jgi:hypothetical protein
MINVLIKRLYLIRDLSFKPVGVLVIGALAIGLTLINIFLSTQLVLLIDSVVVGFLFIFLCIQKPVIGFYVALFIPFITYELGRYYLYLNIPTSFLGQVIYSLLFVILLFRSRNSISENGRALNNPITHILIAIFLFTLLQGLNPNMLSFEGWRLAVRANLTILLVYFVTIFLFKDLKFVRYLLYAWIFVASVGASIACYQQWYGLPSYMIHYITSDPLRYALIFVEGQFRKFPLFNDPASFGMFMASTFLISFVYIFKAQRLREKLLYILACVLMFLATAYSGTRTGFVMIIAGLVLFALMTINSKKTLLLVLVATLSFVVLVFGPFYGNATLNRLRSTFDSDDASLNVRDVNRAYIQPYIYEHPFGGGVMTSDVSGEKFNPGHELAGFPPDSGYLLAAIELGWIGFILIILRFAIVLVFGVSHYFRSNNKEIRWYYLMLTVFIFSLAIANYAQKSTFGIPMYQFVFISYAIISKLRVFDTEEALENDSGQLI